MTTNPLVIGLDGEMSGANLSEGSVLIQAGLAFRGDSGMDVYCEGLRPDEGLSLDGWDMRAQKVHNISYDTAGGFKPASVVDQQASAWLQERGGVPGVRNIITVGFNVMAFDHPFFRIWMPETMSMISRRGIDLNAVCFTLAGWAPDGDTNRDWTSWKKAMKSGGVAKLAAAGIVGVEHDAGYDAALALAGWEWAREQLAGCRKVRELPEGMPADLARTLGPGLAGRLVNCDQAKVRELACSLLASGTDMGRWLGKRGFASDGSSALELVLRGEWDTVLAAAKPA